jgi:hypothetical protein
MAIFVGGKQLENTFNTDQLQNKKVVKSEPRFSNNSLDPQKQYVVINGKHKEIKKHSQYLIDMLTIEE